MELKEAAEASAIVDIEDGKAELEKTEALPTEGISANESDVMDA